MNTPRYEYSRSTIEKTINLLLSLSSPYGLQVRYAIKANPHPEIITMMDDRGIYFDASSSYEAEELLNQGILGNKISLSSQQSPHNLEVLLGRGVLFTATSMNQLKLFLNCAHHPNTLSVRINPAFGAGHNNRTSTGGTSASFGIWHEYIDEVLALAKTEQVTINRLDIHIGSGTDPALWGEVMERSLSVVEKLPDVTVLDIGGGYKVHRYGDEKEADMVEITTTFSKQLQLFFEKTGRKISLEIEPGTYLIAHAGTLVASVDDIVDTGSGEYTFLRLNTGMNDFLRATLYGARHSIEVMNRSSATKEYVVVGHNCESGDILSPGNGNPEEIETRTLKEAEIGDEVRIYDTGAYCASMRAKGYNSFPDAIEVMVD
ncbi:MAG: diaminopimelate decarboxylase [Parcubacteria group bacterium Greene0714_7]|nr:MAG: diaminopimelate decarboxylase [Parcubacteria group bacterium Greene0714_7]